MSKPAPMDEVVRRGYDHIAEKYLSSRDQLADIRFLDQFIERLPAGATVLDLGCGAGVPIDQHIISSGHEIIGIDVSAKQIELARRNVPKGTFEVRDMLALTHEERRIDGVVSFYAIFHTPREQHQDLLAKVNSLLPHQGWLLITMGATDWEGIEHDFYGSTMAWSHYGREKNRELLQRAGFDVALDEISTQNEEQHQILLACKTRSAATC